MRPMLKITLYALFAAILCSCSWFKTAEPVEWPDVANCAPTPSDLVGEVTEVLMGEGDVMDQLSALARRETGTSVACLVDMLVRKWTSPGAASSPQRVHAAARGKAFLEEIQTTIVRSDE